MKYFALCSIFLLIASTSLLADTDRETLIVITETTPSQYKMNVVETVRTTTIENNRKEGTTDSLSYPSVVAEVNGETAIKEIKNADGIVTLSVSLTIVRADDGTTARYELKHPNNDGSNAVRSGEFKIK